MTIKIMKNEKINPLDEVINTILKSQAKTCVMAQKKLAERTQSKQEKNKKPELLAPAGNLEKMKTAFSFGADAVYAGIPDFSLRVRINDFDLNSLKEAIEYAHRINKKVYVTINIFAHNHHLEKLPGYLKKIKVLGPDGLIVSDPGVMQAIKNIWPEAVIHLSTQANCTNWQAAKFWQSQGVERVILGREVTLQEIQGMRKKLPKLELETFVHGAMCMAYSGRCFLSKYYLDRSANLGDCVQPCRWEYEVKSHKITPSPSKGEGSGEVSRIDKTVMIKAKGHDEEFELVEEEHGSYILNSKDMCLIKRLPELIDAGIVSLKIEGRAKSVYYLGVVVGAYRKAIDLIYEKKLTDKELKKQLNNLYKELEEKVVHRGYTEGFAFDQGKLAQNLDNSHKECNWEFCGQVVNSGQHRNSQDNIEDEKNIAGVPLTDILISSKKHQILVKIHNVLKVGDEIEIVVPAYDIIKMKVKNIVDSETGEEMDSAHGGQGKSAYIETDREVPGYSVIRRKIK